MLPVRPSRVCALAVFPAILLHYSKTSVQSLVSALWKKLPPLKSMQTLLIIFNPTPLHEQLPCILHAHSEKKHHRTRPMSSGSPDPAV